MMLGIIQNAGEHLVELRFPKKICLKCLRQLKQSYSFLLQVKASYEQFVKQHRPDAADAIEKEDSSSQNALNTFIEIPQTNEELLLEAETLEEHEDDKDELKEIKLEETMNSSCNEQDPAEDFPNHKTSNSQIMEDKSLDLNDSCEFERQESLSDTEVSESDIESLDEIDMLHEPIAIRCDICQKVYHDRHALYTHKRYSHMPDEKKIQCPLCSHRTSRRQALKVHIELKHGPQMAEKYCNVTPKERKPFACNLCERSYGRRDDLGRHMKTKHINPKEKTPKAIKDTTPFLCAECGKSFSSKKMLNSHLRVHTGDRPYPCDICDKTFKRVKDVKTHRLIHSNIQPFQCSDCDKSFIRADKLKIHMRVHSELRPYKCLECEKTFKYPSVLRTHMYMHTGQTPFACRTCGEEFSLRTSLNNHCLKNGHEK
ncbi:zinc finger and SCAN domain-containing protein 2-like [Musca vetustissima]|uniref:zinc finger and SCAN domain-containing protein 2-like n=1 Tax=Musca vetustissima TaxID=27455 RepID=UPI002AB7C0CE|nr:zinc finger and SCAN domain-containing protein 2-like [Musca vetustissima]